MPKPTTSESFAYSVVKEDLDKLENKYLPHELERTCPVFVKLYNLFESKLPSTGHFASLVATCMASQCVNVDRQANLSIGSAVGQGKTETLRQFCKMPNVNYFDRMSYANYMLRYGGKYIVKLGSEVPYGVRIDKASRGADGSPRILTASAKDYISNRFDVVTSGEAIYTSPDVPKLLQLWNALIEQGWYEGGDRYSGHYAIASPEFPVKHGLIIASTLHDFEKHFLFPTQVGWSSRMVLIIYSVLDVENRYTREGKRRDILEEKPFFANEVTALLPHLNPHLPVKITYESNEILPLLEELEDTLKLIRNEKPGLRATEDIKRLVKGFAYLNHDTKVRYEHVLCLRALLVLCQRLMFESHSKQYFKNLGTKLHFQTFLRFSLSKDQNEVKKQILDTFHWWNGNKPLYTKEMVGNAFNELQAPIIPILYQQPVGKKRFGRQTK